MVLFPTILFFNLKISAIQKSGFNFFNPSKKGMYYEKDVFYDSHVLINQVASCY